MWQPAPLWEMAGLVLDVEWELLVPGWGSASWLSHPVQKIMKINNFFKVQEHVKDQSTASSTVTCIPVAHVATIESTALLCTDLYSQKIRCHLKKVKLKWSKRCWRQQRHYAQHHTSSYSKTCCCITSTEHPCNLFLGPHFCCFNWKTNNETRVEMCSFSPGLTMPGGASHVFSCPL